MPPLTVGDARKVYERKVIPRTGFNKFQKQVLKELCEELGVSVTSTAIRSSSDPTKEDFIRGLLVNKREAQEEDDKLSIERQRQELLDEALRLHDIAEGDSLDQPTTLEWMDCDLMDISPIILDEVTEVVPIESTFSAPVLRVRLYKQAKDWHYVREVAFECNSDGNVDLYKLKEELGVDGNLQVLEPCRQRPFFEYTPGLLHRDDLEDLIDDNFLRVVTDSPALTN